LDQLGPDDGAADQPYRSIGVEPMPGAVFDLATAGPGDAATVPAAVPSPGNWRSAQGERQTRLNLTRDRRRPRENYGKAFLE
jgi:hypothetical protein